MSLVNNATNLHARLLELPQRFGLPSYLHPVEVRKTTVNPGAILPTVTTLALTPQPKIETVPPRLIGLAISSEIIISQNDLRVTNINGNYTPEQLKGEWVVDGKAGYQVLYLKRKTTTYEAILRAPVDKR